MSNNLLKITLLVLIYIININSSLADPTPTYQEVSKKTATIGQIYLDGYLKRDWDLLTGLLSEKSKFEDPTALLVFGHVEQHGKDNIINYFRENYSDIKMTGLINNAFHSGHIAIYDLSLTWSFKYLNDRVKIENMPMRILLKIENGKVSEHLDYAQYDELIKTLNDKTNKK